MATKISLIGAGNIGGTIALLSAIKNLGNIVLIDIAKGIAKGKASAVLAASIFHFKEFTIQEAKNFLQSKGVKVRLA